MEGPNMKFLHGTLEVTVFHATPSAPPLPFSCLSSYGKPSYVTIKLNNKKVAKTSQERARLWNQTFQIHCAHPCDSTITITMKTSCSILGKLHIRGDQFLKESSLLQGNFPLEMENRKPNSKLKLQLSLWFKPAELEPSWGNLLKNGEFQGLRNASFPQRSNCHVTLYQDAHHLFSFHPPHDLCGRPRRLWEDVFKAIEGAKYLIYIAGWSFNPKLVLVRDPETDMKYALGARIGELLKQKAEEGVAVRIMLWDDETSLPLIKNKGVMNTHDQDAFAYFKNTKVVCKLCPRLHNIFPTVFAHHQKTITVDTPSPDNPSNRKILSFVGGLDLCDGRYDTQEHSLFHTLNTEMHCQDFYQTNIPGASLHKGGPRAPWHDTHARITGEAARDVLSNFEQRWIKQCDPASLVPISTIPALANQPLSSIPSECDWKVQVFRSIDHVSTSQLPKNSTVEHSIHDAYVEAIRRADRYIYIENQYFIGGCGFWGRDTHSGCTNLIPIEIALKVANKIRAKERFAVYIVIPMWPEGVPESESVQDILHWTRETMSMMYRLIGEAIKESGGSGHPKDYLNFFCLANREGVGKTDLIPPSPPHPTTQYWNAQMHRRFMVYVHSKVMIVDDIYLLIGSANVNQRSMDGQRDTEIAIGCYQNIGAHSHDKNHGASQNDIRSYRLSLWYEHTRATDDLDLFLEPNSLECVEKIRSIGDKMWKIYSGKQVVDMEGVHLVSYPINVRSNGCVEEVKDAGIIFPDTKAPVSGRRSKVLPSILTT